MASSKSFNLPQGDSYLKRVIYKWRQRWLTFASEYEVWTKTKWLLVKIFDIVTTGTILWYCITYKNFLSYGLIAALATYYLSVIVQEIKRPYQPPPMVIPKFNEE